MHCKQMNVLHCASVQVCPTAAGTLMSLSIKASLRTWYFLYYIVCLLPFLHWLQVELTLSLKRGLKWATLGQIMMWALRGSSWDRVCIDFLVWPKAEWWLDAPFYILLDELNLDLAAPSNFNVSIKFPISSSGRAQQLLVLWHHLLRFFTACDLATVP